MTIILYDLYTTAPGHALSSNTWKARYALNFKGVAHKTEWIELPDIAAFYIKNGITTTLKKADGSPHYSVPLIYDPSTERYINDSFEIAIYLDKTYPGPKIFPHNTSALQSLVVDACVGHLKSIFALGAPGLIARLTPASKAFYESVIAVGYAAGEPTPRVVQWAEFEEGLGKIDELYKRTNGAFLMGDTISWGDFAVCSYLVWVRKVWGEESQEWRDISLMNAGRWADLANELRKYEVVF
ncbi:hypothetical protein HYPSUDRAFT_136415 [Hypholoma sublateritium FD-334 SS-4]|uniref:GST N-terminal domain-containing protein n=1 Tax=Hypholoma sublateritium (strain FD-334 SS-4) TaxID=945553 RepID=A0A0D2P6U7_HYPSF|nr:hypothetical protein HYPSUDRAFT_136415 [Hypholoma sublateritium FD-334 SS-4]